MPTQARYQINKESRWQGGHRKLRIIIIVLPYISIVYDRYFQLEAIGVVAGHELSHRFDAHSSKISNKQRIKMFVEIKLI